MIVKKSFGEKTFDVVNILVMLIMVTMTLYPFLYVTAASLSNPNELVGHKGLLILPKGFNVSAYDMVLKNPNILTGYKNTLILLVVGTSLNLFMTSLGAYVLSRKSFPLRNVMMIAIVFTMYFSGGLIPRYLLIYNTLNMGNKFIALIIPQVISTYNLIVMRTSFMAIPDSLEESARIDGANDFVILFRIILPVSLPIIAVMILFYGVQNWNAWFDAMIFIRDRQNYPLQIILREILITNSTDAMMNFSNDIDKQALSESLKYATIMVATLPILFIYPYVQKYFVKGVMIGAVKG